MTASDRVSVLLDTDIGSDIDDALALAYLLRQPRCELLGVTTVTGDVGKRAALVQILCEAAGRHDVPIHAGASEVLLTGPGQPNVPQYTAVRHRPHRLDRRPGDAIEFMRRMIRSRPGEVTLLSVGPLTNVALLFATDPEVPLLLKRWVCMAGAFGPAAMRDVEWNGACDPAATAVAFGRGGEQVVVPLDVTMQCRLPASQVRSVFRDGLLSIVLEMAEVWFGRRDEIVLHDPLAAILVFRPELCRYERARVEVEATTGKMSLNRDDGGRTLVALDVDAEAAVEEFLQVVGAEA